MSLHTNLPLSEVLRLDRNEVIVDTSTRYQAAGVRSFGRGLFLRPAISGADTNYPKLYRLHTDQVVLSRLFAWEGAVAVVTPEFDGCYVSSEFPTFTVDPDRAMPSYIRHFIKWPTVHERLANATRGLGQRRQRVHAEDFLALEIALPPIDEQRRVADRLDRLDAAATELRRRSEHASALSSALAVSAATRPDLDDEAKARAGWRQITLGEVVERSTAQVQVEPSQRYPIAGIYSFGRGLIDRGPIDGAETSYKTLTILSEGDIVVSKLNGWEGAVAVVGPSFDGHLVSSEYPTFKPDRSLLLPEFFVGIARSPQFWDDLNVNARGSMVRRRRINAMEFLATRIWLPPMEIQQHAARALEIADQAAQDRSASRERIDALVPAALNQEFASFS